MTQVFPLMEKNRTFLVTGGAGFLGFHLSQRLLEMGHYVIGMDNLATGSLANIAQLQTHVRYRFLQQDIVLPFDVSSLDGIFHLACPASPIHYQADPIGTTKTSVIGTLHVLELAAKLNIPILFTSTSEVYGDPDQSPQVETYHGNVNPIGPRSCYDEGKRCAESLCFDFQRQLGVSVKVARLFNSYGPNMAVNDGRVVSSFINQALNDQPITVFGEGKQTRSFCFVSDTIDGLLKLAQSECSAPINLGNPSEITVLALAHKVIALTNSHSEIIYRDLPIDDPKRRCPDISLALDKLGWSPQVTLDKGLELTCRFYSTLLSSKKEKVPHL
ncbi:UDP-glucuronic acid decarboxylase family protein [Marinomonas gallaica]|uniref:UDP-glucuronic acid decarboxylase family protein n=1 Tax=Marinomonas gallaica TaxID=1806667 RepID=UPI000B0F3093|nr:UDP-glucuronic acid decarboxylase family protein [Marinomonas gallaica]